MFSKLSLSKVCQVLEPGPIALVVTHDGTKANIMTMGFHMMVRHNPPLICCGIGPWDHSLKALSKTKQCVVAIPGVDLLEKVVDIGNCSGGKPEMVDKFRAFDFTAIDAQRVDVPLIKECIANLECRVVDTRLGQKYNMYIMEVLAAWRDLENPEQRMAHHRGNGIFTVDGTVMDLSERMTKWAGLLSDDEEEDED
jgi:flavin reductase (DIM6/NTAB) family NADH-FMN oxidoreductase RutF